MGPQATIVESRHVRGTKLPAKCTSSCKPTPASKRTEQRARARDAVVFLVACRSAPRTLRSESPSISSDKGCWSAGLVFVTGAVCKTYELFEPSVVRVPEDDCKIMTCPLDKAASKAHLSVQASTCKQEDKARSEGQRCSRIIRSLPKCASDP